MNEARNATIDNFAGIPIILDLSPQGSFCQDLTVSLSPPLDNIDSIYLTSYFVKNSSRSVIAVSITSDAFASAQACFGMKIRDNITGAATPIPGGGTDTFIQSNDENYTVSAVDPTQKRVVNRLVGYNPNSLVLFIGDNSLTSTVYNQLQMPKLVTRDIRNTVEQLRVQVSGLYGQDVTMDNIKLELRAYPKPPKYDGRMTRSVHTMGNQFGV